MTHQSLNKLLRAISLKISHPRPSKEVKITITYKIGSNGILHVVTVDDLGIKQDARFYNVHQMDLREINLIEKELDLPQEKKKGT